MTYFGLTMLGLGALMLVACVVVGIVDVINQIHFWKRR